MPPSKLIAARPVLRLACATLVAASACSAAARADSRSYTKIDDMEGAGARIDWLPPGVTVPGTWFSAVDCPQADRIFPLPNPADPDAWTHDDLAAPHETFPGVASTRAARLRTLEPLVGGWGASMSVSFDGGSGELPAGVPCEEQTGQDFPAQTVDLSGYAGLTFWARAAAGGKMRIRAQLNDRNTDPRGGICNAADSADISQCYNQFGAWISLTDEFKRYEVPFSELLQNPDWGYQPQSGLDPAHVYFASFQVETIECFASSNAMCAGGSTPPLSFDFWIDDLYLVNK